MASPRDRRSHPTNPNRLLAMEREQKALALAQRGVSVTDIARQLGFAQPSGAHRALARALKKAERLSVQHATRLRFLQFLGLQDKKRRLYAQLSGVVMLTKDGAPILDAKTEAPKLRPLTVGELCDVVRTMLKVDERVARLMGLDLQAVGAAIPPDESEGGLPAEDPGGEVLTFDVSAEVVEEVQSLRSDPTP